MLLLPLLGYLSRLARDRRLMGEHVASRGVQIVYWLVIALVAVGIAVMGWFSLAG